MFLTLFYYDGFFGVLQEKMDKCSMGQKNPRSEKKKGITREEKWTGVRG
jgi:hypothetical protein